MTKHNQNNKPKTPPTRSGRENLVRLGELLALIVNARQEAQVCAELLNHQLGHPPPDWGNDWLTLWVELSNKMENAEVMDVWKKQAEPFLQHIDARESGMAKLNAKERLALGIVNPWHHKTQL